MGPDTEMRAVARRQHGVVGDRQARAAGMDRRKSRRRLDSGAMEPLSDRVVILAGAPATDKARAGAAVLDVRGEAYLSHTSAAWLWGIPGFQLRPIEVARRFEGTRRPSGLAHVHNLRGVPQTHLGEVDGVPVASPVLTCFQVAAITASLKRTERAVDNVIALGLARPAAFHDLLTVLARRGRNGIRIMRRITEARPREYVAPESGNEVRFQALCVKWGVPVKRQVNIGTDDHFVTRVDFQDAEYPWLVFRIQSARWHGAAGHARDDAEQKAKLTNFQVVDVWDHDLWRNPDRVAEVVLAARMTARLRRREAR